MKDGHWNAGMTTAAGILLGALLFASCAAASQGGLTASDWLQFAATLIGAAATIAAGATAWFAAQRQIYSREDRAIETIYAFGLSAQIAAITARRYITKKILAGKSQDGMELDVEPSVSRQELERVETEFSSGLAMENDLETAYIDAPPIVIFRARKLWSVVNKFRGDLKDPRSIRDLKSVRQTADRIIFEFDNLNLEIDKHGKNR